jgi:hypothetical protein
MAPACWANSREAADELRSSGVQFAFGGTPPVAAQARALGFFQRVFDGTEPDEATVAYLRGQVAAEPTAADYPQRTVERIAWKAPYPILRHHFGLPTMAATVEGIAAIAEARVLDVISLGIDQDAQENFYHPERQDPRRTGAGGVPVRSADDYRALYAASRGATIPCCAATPAPTISRAWPRCTLTPSTSPGAPCRCFGSTAWTAAAPGGWRIHRRPPGVDGLARPATSRWRPTNPTTGACVTPRIPFLWLGLSGALNARAAGVHDYIAQFMFNTHRGSRNAWTWPACWPPWT